MDIGDLLDENPEMAESVLKFARIMQNHEEVLIGPQDIENVLMLIQAQGKEKTLESQTEVMAALFG